MQRVRTVAPAGKRQPAHLYRDDVGLGEWLIRNQILPVARLDVETVDRISRIDVTRSFDGDEMGMRGKDFEGERIVVVAFCILGESEPNEVARRQLLARHRVRAVLAKVRNDLRDVVHHYYPGNSWDAHSSNRKRCHRSSPLAARKV